MNESRLLFRKYAPLITSLTKHQWFCDWLGDNTLKVPINSRLFPSGTIEVLEHDKNKILLARYRGTTAPVYGNKLNSALYSLDKVAVFLKTMEEAERFFLSRLGLLKHGYDKDLLDFASLRAWFLQYAATYTGNPRDTAATIDKRIYFNTEGTWASLHDAATGTAVDDGPDSIRLTVGAGATTWTTMARYFATLDLTETGANADVTGSPTYGIFITAKTETLASQSLRLTPNTQASNDAVITADYDQLGTAAQATDLTIAGVTTSAVNNWTLNAAGIATLEAAAGGIVKLGGRMVSDADNAEPTKVASKVADISFHHGNGATPPLLTFEYTPVAGGAPFNLMSKYWP